MMKYASHGWKCRICGRIGLFPSRDRQGAADKVCAVSSRPLPDGRGSEKRRSHRPAFVVSVIYRSLFTVHYLSLHLLRRCIAAVSEISNFKADDCGW